MSSANKQKSSSESHNFGHRPIKFFLDRSLWSPNRKHAHDFYDFAYQSDFSLGPWIKAHPHLSRKPHPASLLNPIRDLRLLSQSKDKVFGLLQELFPEANQDLDSFAITLPFRFLPLLTTQIYAQRFLDEGGLLSCQLNLGHEQLQEMRIRIAAFCILRSIYGVDVGFPGTHMEFLRPRQEGFPEVHGIEIDPRFYEVHHQGKKLTTKHIDTVIESFDKPKALLTLLPPTEYSFSGFFALRTHDVTLRTLHHELQRTLTSDGQGLMDGEHFANICGILRRIFQSDNLRFSLAVTFGDVFLVAAEHACRSGGCVFQQTKHVSKSDWTGSVLAAAEKNKESFTRFRPGQGDRSNTLDHELLQCDRDWSIVIPLRQGERSLGYLVVATPCPREHFTMNLVEFDLILPVITLSVEQSLHQAQMSIDAKIKDSCTAIHPTVEWRFQSAAARSLIQNEDSMAEIRFDQVFPFYAVSDIRGSSNFRNAAILADLRKQVDEATRLFEEAKEAADFPIFSKVLFELRQAKINLDVPLSAGTETTMLTFFKERVHPSLSLVSSLSGQLAASVKRYRDQLDAQQICFSLQRSAFEESVSQVNTALTRDILDRQKLAQQCVPHYFETQATDGIDHGIYAGQSLLKSGIFANFHLDNLRLWQLEAICSAERICQQLRPHLPIPLELAHLVVAHEGPISLRFSYQEKKFDIVGAYSVRYELLKKRIDKAEVKETGERITQPGSLVVIYSTESERRVYISDLNYLADTGQIAGNYEDHALGDLQGVSGLRALRCRINATV